MKAERAPSRAGPAWVVFASTATFRTVIAALRQVASGRIEADAVFDLRALDTTARAGIYLALLAAPGPDEISPELAAAGAALARSQPLEELPRMVAVGLLQVQKDAATCGVIVSTWNPPAGGGGKAQ